MYRVRESLPDVSKRRGVEQEELLAGSDEDDLLIGEPTAMHDGLQRNHARG